MSYKVKLFRKIKVDKYDCVWYYNHTKSNREVIAKMKNKIIELSVMAVFFIVISRKFDDIDKKLMQIKESYNITGKKLTY